MITAQDRYGSLVLPIGATLVLALLAWAGQTPTRFVPQLKRAPSALYLDGPHTSYICTTTLLPPVSTTATMTTSTATFGGGIVSCYRNPPPIP